MAVVGTPPRNPVTGKRPPVTNNAAQSVVLAFVLLADGVSFLLQSNGSSKLVKAA